MAVAVSQLAWEGAEALLGGHCPLIMENTLVCWAGQTRPLGRRSGSKELSGSAHKEGGSELPWVLRGRSGEESLDGLLLRQRRLP